MTCSETKTKREYFERKFGAEGTQKMQEMLAARGKEEGITLCVIIFVVCLSVLLFRFFFLACWM